MSIDLSKRSFRPELMDAPDVDEAALRGALDEIVAVNRALGGYSPSLRGVEMLVPRGARAFSILDVGCGSGDTLRRVVDWARQRGIAVRALGVELSPVSAAAAREACAGYPEIAIELRDFRDLDPARRRFDIVHAAMMLHHTMDEGELREALRHMDALARRGVVVNDLHRHWMAYWGIAALMRLLSRNPLIRHDAPLSVARGFLRRELRAAARAAGFRVVNLSWHWAFRWLMVLKKIKKVSP